jgi:V/A-type H+/Na+-transporting ATPase subunit D
VNRAATRSRWLELTRDLTAAQRGRELLDRKREVLVREILRVRARRDAQQREAAAAFAAARFALDQAQLELGSDAVDAAALAQPPCVRVAIASRTLLGVALPTLTGRFETFRVRYAPGATSESLDRAAGAFSALMPLLIHLAEEELAAENLRRGLARTNRRWNALDRVVLPALTRQIHEVENAIEEDARDEAVRTRRRAQLTHLESGEGLGTFARSDHSLTP